QRQADSTVAGHRQLREEISHHVDAGREVLQRVGLQDLIPAVPDLMAHRRNAPIAVDQSGTATLPPAHEPDPSQAARAVHDSVAVLTVAVSAYTEAAAAAARRREIWTIVFVSVVVLAMVICGCCVVVRLITK